jgi:hypothetical protein
MEFCGCPLLLENTAFLLTNSTGYRLPAMRHARRRRQRPAATNTTRPTTRGIPPPASPPTATTPPSRPPQPTDNGAATGVRE